MRCSTLAVKERAPDENVVVAEILAVWNLFTSLHVPGFTHPATLCSSSVEELSSTASGVQM